MRFTVVSMCALFVLGSVSFQANADDAKETLTLHPRTRVETSPKSGLFHVVTNEEQWDPAKTAIVICDMWDKHWCQGATRRVAEMAPRMNQVIAAARDKGVMIIHCPSDTMKFYEGTPERKLAQAAPKAETREPIRNWCSLDFRREGLLPINDSDGGCDCVPQCKQGSPWRRQIDVLEIKPGDAVTDSSEAFNLMRERGIDNVIVMGVHTNMCVLGRPFSIRQMVKQGQRVLLMRDMTDTMYNSRKPPYVSHFTGTDLVVEHIEKYWCPTITSADFLGGDEFRFPADHRKHIAIVMAEDEYQTEKTLPPFALSHLGKDFRISLVFGDNKVRNSVPGLEILDDADVALISVRRRPLPAEQLDHVRNFVAMGKPVVGIRTASHAFAPKWDVKLPEGVVAWESFDQDVLGGNYHGHHKNKSDSEPTTHIWPVVENASHPILQGFPPGEQVVRSWLYKTSPLEPNTTTLLMGRVEDRMPHEPVAWTFARKEGGKSFYSSLGHPDDFKLADVRRLLTNGIYWVSELPIPTSLPEHESGSTTASK